MNERETIPAHNEASGARICERLKSLALSWENEAREYTITAPVAAGVLTRCGNELAAALVRHEAETNRTEPT